MAKILLEMKNITKTFPGVKALDNVNLQVEEGEVHALVGENGAGKSTLMNVLSGIYPYGSYEGDIIYNGEVCKFNKIKDSEEKGIVIIHQELALVPEMTIGENMYLGNEQGKSFAIDWSRTYGEADKYLAQVGLKESSRTLIKDIGTGKQQLVEIAKALAKNAKLLILDEPTSSLNEEDSQALLDLMLEFKKQGMTSIIISHKLNEIAYVADKITVIRDGSTIETLDKKKDTFTEDRIIKGMVGRELTDRFPKREKKNIGDVALEVKNWTVHHPLYSERKVVDNVSMYVKKGEVLGISGLMGAGRTETMRALFGADPKQSGDIYINGEKVDIKTPKDAVSHGIGYLSEDRKRFGIIVDKTVAENSTMASLDEYMKGLFIDKKKEKEVAQKYVDILKTKTPGVDQLVVNLSGGNQQKVVIAKWLVRNCDILIFDEPTRGIDVGAKSEIYHLMNELVAEGKSIIMVSSEMTEILRMSDRIVIMCEGRKTGELGIEEATQERIMHAATLRN